MLIYADDEYDDDDDDDDHCKDDDAEDDDDADDDDVDGAEAVDDVGATTMTMMEATTEVVNDMAVAIVASGWSIRPIGPVSLLRVSASVLSHILQPLQVRPGKAWLGSAMGGACLRWLGRAWLDCVEWAGPGIGLAGLGWYFLRWAGLGLGYELGWAWLRSVVSVLSLASAGVMLAWSLPELVLAWLCSVCLFGGR